MKPPMCSACGGRRAKSLGYVDGIPVLRCRGCRSLVTLLTDTDAELSYEDYYHEGNLSPPQVVSDRLDAIFAEFHRYRSSNRLLDVGFGDSTGLMAARRAGWDAEGVEVSDSAIEPARARGFRVFHGVVEDAGYQDDRFDVVVLSEVLEHVDDPRHLLQSIRRVLRQGGLLWTTTPNGDGLSARLLGLSWSVVSPPEHRLLFSQAGLVGLLRVTGFEPQQVLARGLNVFELLSRIRAKLPMTAAPSGFDRVQSGQQMLERVDAAPALSRAAGLVNQVLVSTGLGDSLKVWAVKA